MAHVRQELGFCRAGLLQCRSALADPVLQVAVEFEDLLLLTEALGHVDHDGHDMRTTVEGQGAEADLGGKGAAILPPALHGAGLAHRSRAGMAHEFGPESWVLAPDRFRGQFLDGQADQFGSGIAKHVGQLRVGQLDPALLVNQQHGDGRDLDQAAKQVHSLFAIGHIDAGTDVPLQLTLLIEIGRPVVLYPAILAVITTQTVIHGERLPPFERVEINPKAAVQILGVHPLGPAVALLLLQRASGKVQPGLVEVVTKRVQPGDPDHHRRRVGHLPEASLALDQRPLRDLGLVDVANDPGMLPMLRAETAADLGPTLAAIGS